MAVTPTINKGLHVPGDEFAIVVTVVFDASYEAGGEPLSLQTIGFSPGAVFDHADILNVRNLTEQAIFIPNTAYYDGTLIHLYDAATGKELAAAKDVSKVTVQMKVYVKAP